MQVRVWHEICWKEGQVLAFSKEMRDEMNLLGSEFGSKTIATADILSAKGINGTYSTLIEPVLLFSSSSSLHTAFLVSLHVRTSHLTPSCHVS